MPAVARKGDGCTGHANYPPRDSIGGSDSVFANGVGVHRQGDGWAVHCNNDNCHDATLSGGSGSVFANGRAVGRVGDWLTCGSCCAAGSGDVFAGG